MPHLSATWNDIHHACRLALDMACVPDDFQSMNMVSYRAQAKVLGEKARRILGHEPQECVDDLFKRRQ